MTYTREPYETTTAIPMSSVTGFLSASGVASLSQLPHNSYTSSYIPSSRMQSFQSLTSEFLNTTALAGGGDSSNTDPIGMILGGTSVGAVGLGILYLVLQQLKKRGINPLGLLQVGSSFFQKQGQIQKAPSEDDEEEEKKNKYKTRKHAFGIEADAILSGVVPVLSSTPPPTQKPKLSCPHCGKKPETVTKVKKVSKKAVDVSPPQTINDSIYEEMEEGKVEEPVQFPHKNVVEEEEVEETIDAEEIEVVEQSKTVIEIEKESLEEVVRVLEAMKKKYSVIEI